MNDGRAALQKQTIHFRHRVPLKAGNVLPTFATDNKIRNFFYVSHFAIKIGCESRTKVSPFFVHL